MPTIINFFVGSKGLTGAVFRVYSKILLSRINIKLFYSFKPVLPIYYTLILTTIEGKYHQMPSKMCLIEIIILESDCIAIKSQVRKWAISKHFFWNFLRKGWIILNLIQGEIISLVWSNFVQYIGSLFLVASKQWIYISINEFNDSSQRMCGEYTGMRDVFYPG